jgi:hypothetical protein
MSIPEPKVAHHHGRGIRSCPIFPELRLILDEAFEIFGSESEYVVATQRDAKNDSILAARREMQRRDPPCTELHGRYRRLKELAKNAKNPGKTRVF